MLLIFIVCFLTLKIRTASITCASPYLSNNGVKSISGLSSGDYEIRLTSEGYYPSSYYVTLNSTGDSIAWGYSNTNPYSKESGYINGVEDTSRDFLLRTSMIDLTTDPKITIGDLDTVYEWNATGNYSSDTQSVDLAENITEYLTDCSPGSDGYCLVPFLLLSSTPGKLRVHSITMNNTYDPNPVYLDKSLLDAYLGSFSSGVQEIPIEIITGSEGNITVDDVRIDYAGGNDTIEILTWEYIGDQNTSILPENLTFSGDENITRNFSVPILAYVSEAYMYIEGNESGGVSPTNPYLEVGNPDGDREWSYSGEYSNDTLQGGTVPSAYWKFNNDSLDSSGNGHEGELIEDGGSYQTGKLNSSLYCNGSSEGFIVKLSNGSLNFDTGNFSIGLWVNYSGNLASNYLVSYINTQVDSGAYALTTRESGLMRFNDGEFAFETAKQVNDSVWHRIWWVREGTGANLFKVYIDGALNNTFTLNRNLSYTPNTINFCAAPLNLSIFEGYIDDVLLYKGTALNSSYILTDWNEGGGREYPFTSIGDNLIEKSEDFGAVLNGALNDGNCDCDNCELNGTNCLIPFLLHSDTAGVLGYSNVSIFYDLKNKSNNDSLDLVNFYSKFSRNLPYTWTDKIFFLPRTNSSKNVSAYGQTSTIPLINITTQNYGGKNMNISVRINESFSCINISWNLTNEKSPINKLNTSWQEIASNLELFNNTKIWFWADLEQCDPSDKRILRPLIEFESYCEDCVWEYL